MSTIVAFVPRAGFSGKASGPSGRPPEIIIFPGVRYERLESSTFEPLFAPDEPPANRVPVAPCN